jgi:hypothetical protein
MMPTTSFPRTCAVAIALVSLAVTRAAGQERVITLTATEYEFQSPDSVEAGVVRARLVSAGKQNHQAQLVRLDAGRTIDDVKDWIADGDLEKPPAWLTWMGGPGIVPPGATSSTTLALRPGSYAWLCFTRTPPPDRIPHVLKGMVRGMTVVTGPGPQLPRLPTGDVLLLLTDYEFSLSHPLKSGRQTVRVRNNASQRHLVAFVRLHPGKTMDDLIAFSQSPSGPPPVSVVGAVTNLDPGQVNLIDIDLTPGDYGMICFAPDAGDHRPHYEHGMVTTFHID